MSPVRGKLRRLFARSEYAAVPAPTTAAPTKVPTAAYPSATFWLWSWSNASRLPAGVDAPSHGPTSQSRLADAFTADPTASPTPTVARTPVATAPPRMMALFARGPLRGG